MSASRARGQRDAQVQTHASRVPGGHEDPGGRTDPAGEQRTYLGRGDGVPAGRGPPAGQPGDRRGRPLRRRSPARPLPLLRTALPGLRRRRRRPRMGPGAAALSGRAGMAVPGVAARPGDPARERRGGAGRPARGTGRRRRGRRWRQRLPPGPRRAVAGARVRGAALAVPPEGGRPARLGAAPAVGAGEGGDGRRGVRRVRWAGPNGCTRVSSPT